MHEAKKYLLKYGDLKTRAKQLEEKIDAIRSRYMFPASPELSDMPKAHNSEHDLSDMMAAIGDLTDQLVSAYTKCVGLEGDILKRLEQMPDVKERTLLTYAYIDGLKWGEIADLMGYSYSWVTHTHGDALNHFPLPSLQDNAKQSEI